MIVIVISKYHSSCEEAGLNGEKKYILTWFCEAIISDGIFSQEMKECLGLPLGSCKLFSILWKGVGGGINQVVKTEHPF